MKGKKRHGVARCAYSCAASLFPPFRGLIGKPTPSHVASLAAIADSIAHRIAENIFAEERNLSSYSTRALLVA